MEASETKASREAKEWSIAVKGFTDECRRQSIKVNPDYTALKNALNESVEKMEALITPENFPHKEASERTGGGRKAPENMTLEELEALKARIAAAEQKF
jgi:hypothetical protein